MSSIGTGYDLSNSVFSPDGRNFQVEYASKAVENGGTAIGIKCTNGVVFAVEKIVTSKLLKPKANRRIQTIDTNIGIIYSGLVPDGRHLANRARKEANEHRKLYHTEPSVSDIVKRMGMYVQAYTLYNSVRPFGISTIVGGVDEDGPQLCMIEPSGSWWGYKGAASGKGRQAAKSELEKLDFETITVDEAIKEAARIIYLAHEDSKDKEFELEISVATKSGHSFVSEDVLEAAKEHAVRELSGDDEDDAMEE